MGRKRINQERITARFPADTLERIERLLQDKETEAQFVRDAVAAEIKRRWRVKNKERQLIAK